MDYRKVAILISVAVLVIGGAAIGLVAWRARQLTTPAAELPQDGGLEPGPGGATGTPGTGSQPEAQPPALSEAVTTINPEAKATACDTGTDGLDCDYDHLTNKEERERKTDPLKDDADGDGLLDSSEIYVWKSNPLNPRSIDPSMTDLEAVNAGKRDTR
jgi:hypothetical protein